MTCTTEITMTRNKYHTRSKQTNKTRKNTSECQNQQFFLWHGGGGPNVISLISYIFNNIIQSVSNGNMTNYPINRITSEKSVLFCLALSLSSILYIYYTPTHTRITQSKNRIFSHSFPITNVCLYTSRTHDILYGDDNGLELIQFHYSFSFPQRYVTLRSTFIVQAFSK